MKNQILLLGALLILVPSFSVKAQMSHSDSSFVNLVSTEQTYISYWNKPGTWFDNPEVSSLSGLYDLMDQNYPFETTEFTNCYATISVPNSITDVTMVNQTVQQFEDSTGIFLYGLDKPFRRLDFSLGSKTGKTFAIMDSSHVVSEQHDIAFLVITGTGTNMAKGIIDGTGYHNLNCFANNLVNKLGDVFVPIVPNDELRAIYFNKKKMTSTGTGNSVPYLLSYLNAAGRAYGVNRLIETVAWVKYLKKMYKRVVVLGLSTGGKVAHWASLLAEPDATMVSSGYSVLVDNDVNSQLVNSMSYGNYLLTFDKDSIRNRTSQLKTQFLFTMCQNDTWLSQLDIDSSYTKNFYQGVGNVSFFYNYVNHAFPPCNTIDTFLQRVLTMPKVTASVDSDRCHMDSLFVNLQFEGQAPFQFQVVKDGQSIGSYLSSSNAMSISLSMEGNYVIDSLMDAQGVKGYRSDTIYYTKHPTPSLITLSQHVVCDSQKTAIHFQCDGKSPWTLYYDRNSSLDSVLLDTSIDTVLWNNGNYHLITLRDANQCEIYLSSNITIDYELPNAMLQSKVFNCVSNQFILNWQSAGAFPLTLSYYDSTLSQSSSRLLTSPQMPLVFENGNYHFLAVKDSNQCVVTLDTTVKLFATPTSIKAGPLNYMCSMPFASINVNYTGAPPFQLYLEDAMSSRVKMSQLPTDTLQLPFGNTIIHQMIDANGCITKLADTNFYNPNKPIQLNEVKATFGCDSQEFTVGMKVDATFPLTAYCRWNDSSFILQMPTSATVISLPAGRFRMDSLNDINSCYLTNLIDTQLYKIAPPVFQLQQSNFDLIAPYTPLFHEYKWFRNGLLIATTYDSVLHMTQQGRYFVEVIDSMNCTRQSQLLDVQLNNGLIFPNPFKDEITVFLEPDPGEKVQMAICDVAGRTLMKFNLTHNLTSLHLGALPKGNYVVHFFTNSPYKKYTSRHILKK